MAGEADSSDFNFFLALESYNLILLKLQIFLNLDYKSLHVSRQVCKDWNAFILQEIWKSRRPHVERMLTQSWRTEPDKRHFDVAHYQGFYMAVDNTYVGVGTKNNKTLLYEADTGVNTSCLTDGSEDRMFWMSEALDEEANNVQLDMTEDVIVTVTGSGNVNVWNRRSLERIYSDKPHGNDNVLGVRIIGDFIVTGGSRGSIVSYSLHKEKNEVVVEYNKKEKANKGLSHIDSDGVHVLVGTESGMVMWDFSVRSNPIQMSQVRCGPVCCCVMSYPYAFCTGLFLNYGVQVWDMNKAAQIRQIHKDLSMWVIAIKNNILATSMSVIRLDDVEWNKEPSIFLHDLRELVDTNVKTDKLWTSEFKCPVVEEVDPHIAINSTSLFAITKNVKGNVPEEEKGCQSAVYLSRIHVWDFWNYRK